MCNRLGMLWAKHWLNLWPYYIIYKVINDIIYCIYISFSSRSWKIMWNSTWTWCGWNRSSGRGGKIVFFFPDRKLIGDITFEGFGKPCILYQTAQMSRGNNLPFIDNFVSWLKPFTTKLSIQLTIIELFYRPFTKC